MKEVLETSEWVARRGVHVQIDEGALEGVSKRLARDRSPIPPWEGRYHFRDGTIRTVWYFLVLDSLNFCFWPLPGSPRWEIMVDSEPLSGYYGLAASLRKAFLAGVRLDDPAVLSGITREELGGMIGGRGELQLMGKRAEILQELGQVLATEYGGKPENLLEEAGGSALKLARLLASRLCSFRDEAHYQGRKIFFYKRAQILGADLFGGFGGKGWGAFSDMGRLTAFADYKLPQVLRQLGVLRLDDDLAGRVDTLTLIEAGSPEEIEIRANTIRAVELLRKGLQREGVEWGSFEIDWMLWSLGQGDAFRKKPYHRTVTIFY